MRHIKIFSIFALTLLLSLSCKAMETVCTTIRSKRITQTGDGPRTMPLIKCKVWNMQTGKKLKSFPVDDILGGATVSRDGTLLVTTKCQDIKICNIDSGQEIEHPSGIAVTQALHPTFSHDGKKVAHLTFHRINIFYLEEKELQSTNIEYSEGLNALALNHDGTRIAYATNNKIKISRDFYFYFTSLVFVVDIDEQDVNSLTFNHDGTQIACATKQQEVKIFDTNSGQELKTIDTHTFGTPRMKVLAFNHDSTILVIKCHNTIVFYNLTDDSFHTPDEIEDENRRFEMLISGEAANDKDVLPARGLMRFGNDRIVSYPSLLVSLL